MYETYGELMERKLELVPNHLDKRQGSIIFDALAPNAVETAQFYADLKMLENRTFGDTATGEDLTRRTAERGVFRKTATKALFIGSFTDGQWLDGFCNGKNYWVTLGYDRYVLQVVLKLSVKQRRKEVLESLRKMIPANLILEVLLDYNTHGKLRPLTHGELKCFSVDYGTIKEMNFSKENQE